MCEKVDAATMSLLLQLTVECLCARGDRSSASDKMSFNAMEHWQCIPRNGGNNNFGTYFVAKYLEHVGPVVHAHTGK